MITYGVDKFYIELLENYNCNTKNQLEEKEAEYIKKYKTYLEEFGYNKVIPCRTQIEYREENRDIIKERKKKDYEKNKEKRKQTVNAYRLANQDIIREKKRIAYQKKMKESRASSSKTI
jgi:hypothetical protein